MSSPGRYHVYWLVDGLRLADFRLVQAALAEYYGADRSVIVLLRVMKLPGFCHLNATLGQHWHTTDGGLYCHYCWRDYTTPKSDHIPEGRV